MSFVLDAEVLQCEDPSSHSLKEKKILIANKMQLHAPEVESQSKRQR